MVWTKMSGCRSEIILAMIYSIFFSNVTCICVMALFDIAPYPEPCDIPGPCAGSYVSTCLASLRIPTVNGLV